MTSAERATALYLREIDASDADALIAVNAASQDLHQPWVASPYTRDAVDLYLERLASPDTVGVVVIDIEGEDESDAGIVGVFNISQIFRGGFQNAYLGFYANAARAGRGDVTAAMRLVLGHVFDDLALHRVEANVQPGNLRSRALVERVGFRLEGFSPNYLYIDGAWRDHERWAMTVEDRA